MGDIALVRIALKRYRRIARMFRRGGLGLDLGRAQRALKALDRIEQPPLWGDDTPQDYEVQEEGG